MLRTVGKRVPGVLGVILAAWLLAFAGPAFAQADKAPEVCKGCHEGHVENFAASKHGQKGNLKGPANNGSCLTCHGANALEHAKQGGGRGVGGIINLGSKTVSADLKNETCLSCHAKSST